jgi:hypothetical protein
MKKLLIIALVLTSFTRSRACDVCGCANSGSYFGLMPQSHKSMLGLRYSNLNFETHPGSGYFRTNEQFRITELYGRFYPAKRVQVMAFLPYRVDQQLLVDGSTKKQQGWGDATVLVNYNVLNTFMDSDESHRINHSL